MRNVTAKRVVTLAGAAAIVSLALVPARSASGQLLFQVCRETCPDPLRDPVGASTCHTRVALCETKLGLYNTYMGQMGAGVTTYQLPSMYRELLQPFYSNNLANWRFAFSNRQPPDNATTDCSVTYFNRENFVLLLREGKLDGLWDWLFHEIAHFDQCRAVGGRDAYARMWFGHLEIAFLQNNDIGTIHDRMMMEGSAETVAQRVLERTRVLRDVNNRLVRPISVTLRGPFQNTIGDRVTVLRGTTYRITATVNGGSDPLERQWLWRVPGSNALVLAPTRVSNDGNTFDVGANVTGTHRVRLTVSQPNSNLVPALREVIVEVVERQRTIQ